MNSFSKKNRTLCAAVATLAACLAFVSVAQAKETPPVIYRGAPIIPWAKKTGEHRFRSPRRYDDTLNYYRKIFAGNPHVKKIKIINTTEVRAVHYKNLRPKGRWEGFNIYEYKGATTIFVVFSDKELKKIAHEKENPEKAKKKKKKKKRTKRAKNKSSK